MGLARISRELFAPKETDESHLIPVPKWMSSQLMAAMLLCEELHTGAKAAELNHAIHTLGKRWEGKQNLLWILPTMLDSKEGISTLIHIASLNEEDELYKEMISKIAAKHH